MHPSADSNELTLVNGSHDRHTANSSNSAASWVLSNSSTGSMTAPGQVSNTAITRRSAEGLRGASHIVRRADKGNQLLTELLLPRSSYCFARGTPTICSSLPC